MLLLLTGLIGYYLAKTEGRLVPRNIIKEIRQAHIPGDELLNGFCILIGGLLLPLSWNAIRSNGYNFNIPWNKEVLETIYYKKN